MYAIKEMFYTLQGEGAHAGRPAVFIRFAGCNLWSGREADRASAVCKFCDTDFTPEEGVKLTAIAVAARARDLWPGDTRGRTGAFAVITGGEPALQLKQDLVAALRSESFEVAVETNGTVELPGGLHWVTVSPKAGAPLVVRSGDELKLVYPQAGAEPHLFESLDFGRFYLQPMDGTLRDYNTRSALQYCLDHPRWRLSLQTHKFLGIR